jgi:hypothetical protein
VDARDVAVHFTLPHSPAAQHFGISVTAHWSDAPAAVRHEITLEQVTIHRDLDGASESNTNPTGQEREQTPSPGEWVLYAAANGRWAQLPRISEVRDGQVTPLGLLWSYWLPRGVPPRLFVGGRECDEPILDCRAEQYAATSADQQPSTELGFNDRPGRVQISDGSHLGVPMSRGRQTYRPTVAAVGHNNEDQSDPTCGAPCYSVTATLRSASAPGVDLDGGTGPGTGGAGDGGSGGGGLAGTGGLALGVAAVATTAAALGIRRLGRGLRGPAARP